MLITMTILGLFLFIFISLGSALFCLIMDKQPSVRMVRALTWRIGLSLLLFALLLVAFALGWIHPHTW